MGQYSEVKAAPAKATIVITRALVPDDSNDSSSPAERDQGFWPSEDAESPGWVGVNPLVSFEAQMKAARARMAAWKRGTWAYVGVRAVAVITIPISAKDVCTYKLESAGVWGVESDAGDAYLNELFQEQADELRQHMYAMQLAEIHVR